MKRLVFGLIVGVLIGTAATAFAVPSFRHFRPAPAPRCVATAVGTQYTCTLPHNPSAALGHDYTINIPDLDLTCLFTAQDSSQNLPESFGCSRASTDLKCVDGIFDSLSVNITPRRVEIDEPQTCKLQSASPGYKLTGGYTPHIFYRSP